MEYPHKTRPGYLVENTKTGKKGRTYHDKPIINGKIPIYMEIEPFIYSEKGTLCDPNNWRKIGFID